jgi:hypothetical protein
MFQFPGLPPLILFYSYEGNGLLRPLGFPIRTLTDQGLVQLPVTFRSFPRPSSAAYA